jgi:hypothetical protein
MKIKFSEIELAFDFVSFGQPYEHEAFLDKESGKVFWHSEFDDNEEELPDDLNDEKYLQIPHKNDLDLGKPLVLGFAEQYLPKHLEEIKFIFSRKGAYSKFKTLLENVGAIDKWYEFESSAQEKALRDWCNENDIEVYDSQN